MENEGIPNNYTMREKVALFEVLRNNRPIINMIAKAHQEALRRKKEDELINKEVKDLEKLKKEEEERKKEEKKKLEEDRKRKKKKIKRTNNKTKNTNCSKKLAKFIN